MFLVKRISIDTTNRLKALTELAAFDKPFRKLIIQNTSGQTYVGASNMEFSSSGQPPTGDYWKSTIVEIEFDIHTSLNSIEDVYVINTDSGTSTLFVVAYT